MVVGYETAVVLVLAVVVCVLASDGYGQDMNWDLLNYHYYASYALWNGRFDVDIAASQAQTWFNPLASLAQYSAIQALPPRVAAGVFAALAAVSVALIYLVAVFSLRPEWRHNVRTRLFVASLACVGAFTSPMFRSELGTTMSDVLGGSLILAALAYLLYKNFLIRGYVIGGLLLGVAVGLKLTNAFYFIGWMLALLSVERRSFLKPAFLTGLAAFIGYLPTGGGWAAFIAVKTGNPLFPSYNHVFKSGLYPAKQMIDERFKIDGFAEGLRYFVDLPRGMHPSAEVSFTDARFTLLAILLLIVLVFRRFAVVSRNATVPQADGATIFSTRSLAFLTVFMAVSLVVWMKMFGVQRYTVALEQLAPLLIMMQLSLLLRSRRALAVGIVCVIAVIAVTSKRADWGRTSFTESWFDVQTPAALETGGSLYVMLSGDPMAYVIPFLPQSDSFVRIEGNIPIAPDTGLGARIAQMIATQKGPIWTLAPAAYRLEDSAASLAAYGMKVDSATCVDVPTKAGTLKSCRLLRISS